MLIGYTRVSTGEQETAVQVSALKAAGCERIYRENASGGRWDRPELHRLLDQLRKGDGWCGNSTACRARCAMF
jgi:DNA invertase Pin-like site-specific DNA recombinase